jgi:SAM-dependent methyltransferase
MSEKHFFEQKNHARSYLIPFFEEHLPDFRNSAILEVGCAEGGFLAVLHDQGITDAVGLELDPARARVARDRCPVLRIVVGDITDDSIAERIGGAFDLIVMRDVIEHIPDRTAAFSSLSKLLNADGHLYVTFPPRFSPFAGHQQHGRSLLRGVPYLHLLPAGAIRALGRALKERPEFVESVVENYRIGLSIRSFERYCSLFNLEPVAQSLFLVRPIYQTRFALTPRRAPNIPFVREVIALGCECLLRKAGPHPDGLPCGRCSSHPQSVRGILPQGPAGPWVWLRSSAVPWFRTSWIPLHRVATRRTCCV